MESGRNRPRFLIIYCSMGKRRNESDRPRLSAKAELETLISAGWIEVHVERIAREANRDRVIGRNIDSGQTRGVDALDCHLLRFDRKVVVFGLAEHIGPNVFVSLLQ